MIQQKHLLSVEVVIVLLVLMFSNFGDGTSSVTVRVFTRKCVSMKRLMNMMKWLQITTVYIGVTMELVADAHLNSELLLKQIFTD